MIPNLIVPTLNRYDLLQNFLGTVDYPVAHLLIIDNGGSLDVTGWPVNEFVQKMTVLNMPANLGVSTSWNLGIKSFPFADRWLIASDDMVFYPGGLQEFWEKSNSEHLTISAAWPHFQAFIIGEQVIDKVGLFDEYIHPANFEDDDYLYRCEAFEIPVISASYGHHHVEQGTVHHDLYIDRNDETYLSNEEYYRWKQSNDVLTPLEWSLDRRRLNSWD